jgi:hypothetical protein
VVASPAAKRRCTQVVAESQGQSAARAGTQGAGGRSDIMEACDRGVRVSRFCIGNVSPGLHQRRGVNSVSAVNDRCSAASVCG